MQGQMQGQIIEECKQDLSDIAWRMGERADIWVSRGGSVEDLAQVIGFSVDSLQRYWSVYTRFGKSRLKHLWWYHYFAVMDLPDHQATECLEWADEMQATPAEMKAWHRAQHSEWKEPVSKYEGSAAQLELFDKGGVATSQGLSLDVSAEESRALHRVVRSMHDGHCPACATLGPSEDFRRFRFESKLFDLICPGCGFKISHEESGAALKAFRPVLEKSLAVFERWRK